MITEEEWKNLKAGNVIWFALLESGTTIGFPISKISKNKIYCYGFQIERDNDFVYLKHADAINSVISHVKYLITRLQKCIDTNLEQLEKENVK